LVAQEAFRDICQRVCEELGWGLNPSGVQISLDGGRRQFVALEFFDYEDEQLVRLLSTIGEAAKLTPVRLTIALRINAELAHGAFAVKDDHLMIVDTLMLEDTDPAEFEASVRYVAQTADYYERVIFETDDH
jgi:hypothetical protein